MAAGVANLTDCVVGGGHHSILWAGGIENIWLTCMLFGCLVLFTISWEFLTELLEHKVEHHHAYQELLEKVYKELTSLGMLSFALFIAQDTQAVHLSDDLLISFEFAHYLIFFMALIFVLTTLVTHRGHQQTKREWDTAAAASVHEACEAYASRLAAGQSTCFGRMMTKLGLFELYLKTSLEQQAIEWFLLRLLFLREYGVQIHFDFAKYTRKNLTRSIMRGIEITPVSWGFMLACLVVIGGIDLAQKVEMTQDDGAAGHRRQLAGAGAGGLHPDTAVMQVLVVAAVTWIGLSVQLLLVWLLRRRQQLLLQRKLHMDGWAEDLIPTLKSMHQELQADVLKAESHGHDHLPARNETSMDGDPAGSMGLREQYEDAAYPWILERRVRWSAHCVTMWSCFSLAYYCMDLVAIVGVTGWVWWQQALAHVLLVTPHVALALMITPALIKYESLLSCVVRRVDEMVASVVHHMERTSRVCDSLRKKVVDAHRQELEDAAPREGGVGTLSTIAEDTQSRKRQLSQHFQRTLVAETGGSSRSLGAMSMSSMDPSATVGGEFSDEQLNDAVKWLFHKISRGDKEIRLQRLRVGLHKINAYFTQKDWALLCRLLDRDRTRRIEERDLLIVLAPQESTPWQPEASHKSDKFQTSADEDKSVAVDIDAITTGSSMAPGGTGTLTNFLFESNTQRAEAGARLWGWMYEDVEDIATAASPRSQGSTPTGRSRSHTTPARMHERETPQTERAGQQPSVSFAADEEFAPEPETESAGTPQP